MRDGTKENCLLKNIQNIKENYEKLNNQRSEQNIEEQILNLFNDHIKEIHKNEYEKYNLLEDWNYNEEEYNYEYKDIVNKLLDDYDNHSNIFDDYNYM